MYSTMSSYFFYISWIKDTSFNDNTSNVKRCRPFAPTDVCSEENVPEVEIFSLLEEKIPRYALRAETIEDFYGNKDWIQTPLIPADIDLELTPDLIEATLTYFSE